ncbi:MAG: NADP-dependent malic enzyme [Candidatus Nanohaloarchaea archaeon]|nr:NADP-dependent malic enzyme [Candidatus Nanohaloarchaea archaeon]
MTDDDEALRFHERHHGKIKIEGKVDIESREQLNLAYTPGVAAPVRAIQQDRSKVYDYTAKGEMVGILTNGSSTLGMGKTGPEAAIPVMEGKALLARKLADVSAFPLVLDVDETEQLVEAGERLQPVFGFLIMEDIESPACFRVEEQLKQRMDIPVFHDDQHGIAVAALAGLTNALDVTGRDLEGSRIVVVGAGAAGIATTKLLLEAGAEEILVVDRQGILYPGCDGMNWAQQEIAEMTNPEHEQGSLKDAMQNADVVIGLSVGGIISQAMVEDMADDPVVFALANPEPEIMPDEARDAGASVVATGRSDFENQVNNSLVFPGLVKGCLRCRASAITTEMKLTAAEALAGMVDDPVEEDILPSTLEREPVDAIADAVSQQGQEDGVCRKEP